MIVYAEMDKSFPPASYRFMDSIDSLFALSRSAEGRDTIAESEGLAIVKLVCESLTTQASLFEWSSLELELRIKIVRLLRNLCCSDVKHVFLDLFTQHDLIKHAIEWCRDVCLKKQIESDDLKEGGDGVTNEDQQVILAYFQFVANFTANGEYAVGRVFQRASRNGDHTLFKDLLAVCTVCRNSKVSVAALAALYNCLRVSEESSSALRTRAIAANRSLVCQLLLLIVDQKSEDSAEVMEWLHLIGSVWVQESLVWSIYQLVGPTDGSDRVTHEQVILLQLVLSVLEDTALSASITASFAAHTFEWTSLLVGLSRRLCLVDAKPAMDFSAVSDGRTQTERTAETVLASIDSEMSQSLSRELLSSALQVVGTALAVLADHSASPELKRGLITETQVMQYTSGLIAEHHVGARISEKRNYSQEAPTQAEEAVKALVRGALCLLGNLVYRSSEAQDLLRECGGLAVVLSHCATDFSNPLAREWALLCLRHATEGSAANQAFIESLRPQSVSIQDERMREQGMNVELNPATGKFKFTQTPPSK